MRSVFLLLIIFTILFSGPTPASGQDAEPDSLLIAAPELESALGKPHRSPMGALLRSVAIPGWGQLYNRKYIKAVLVAGVETFFLVKAVEWWSKTEDQFDLAHSSPPEIQAFEFNRYLNYRQNRNDYLWAAGITVFISMFDAYVDAHLAGFDVDITPGFEPGTDTAELRLRLRF
jgi:hypothetical protein